MKGVGIVCMFAVLLMFVSCSLGTAIEAWGAESELSDSADVRVREIPYDRTLQGQRLEFWDPMEGEYFPLPLAPRMEPWQYTPTPSCGQKNESLVMARELILTRVAGDPSLEELYRPALEAIERAWCEEYE